jgi:hypothetical protein
MFHRTALWTLPLASLLALACLATAVGVGHNAIGEPQAQRGVADCAAPNACATRVQP